MTQHKISWKVALGFDFGIKNIGVAIGQYITCTASPLSLLKAKDGVPNWQEIATYITTWQPDVFVVGVPCNMDGSPSAMQARAEKFSHQLQKRFAIPWYPIDERLTSQEAKSLAYAAGHTGNFSKNPIDSLAAKILLESWMQTHQ